MMRLFFIKEYLCTGYENRNNNINGKYHDKEFDF